MIKVGIVGGTGYTGAELLRLLSAHPEVELCVITSRQEAGRRADDLFPSLRGHVDLQFVSPDMADLTSCDAVFFATPHAAAMHTAPGLLDAGVRVIDLSADFRIKDPELWAQWYGEPHASPALLPEAVYGLPEISRDSIKDAQLLACPGCYPTAVQLGFLPLLEAGLVDTSRLIADAKSGVSGAGRGLKLGSLYVEASESFKTYGIPGHRHLPEIKQVLSEVAGESVGLTFIPHLVPMIRGIEATLYAELSAEAGDLQALYELRYANEPFVDVMPAGSHPDTHSVRGANVCRVAVHRLPADNGCERVVVSSVIDNLVKGAAGQAVQCFNLMFGQDEAAALQTPALLP